MNRSVGLAWLVHFYTSLGLVCALFAVLSLLENRPLEVFFWLALAFAIDVSDGALARWAQVKTHTPQFSGRKLDDIIDYMTYTFIPVCFIYQQDLLSEAWLPVLGFTLIASAYGFCSETAKTTDGFFTGFPSYWNVVAFYLYFLDLPSAAAGVLILVLALMTFWPVRYLYPSQAKEGRWVSIGGGVVWGLLCFWMVMQPQLSQLAVLVSLIYPLWYMGYSIYLHFTRPA
ncbi:MAG: phosphatidylcholine/phosphatidylserine synthase [Halioglobus sp.]